MSIIRASCRLINESPHDLVLAGPVELEHGRWTEGEVLPTRVAAGQTVSWASESHGFMTGTEGHATFTVGGSGTLALHWNIPFIGENLFTQTCSGVPKYVPHEPMSPWGGRGQTAAALGGDDEQIRHGYLVSVDFKLALDDPQQGRDQDGEGRDSPSANHEPKALEVSPGKLVVARDADIHCRKVAYVGLRSASSGLESSAVSAMLGDYALPAIDHAGEVRWTRVPVLSTVTYDGLTDFARRVDDASPEAWIAGGKFPAEQKDKLNRLVRDPEAQRKSGKGPRHVILAVAEILARAEAELVALAKLKQKGGAVDESPLKRLILSGHHCGKAPAFPGCGVIWEDDYKHQLAVDDWGLLAKYFVAALDQVEHLHFSACNTGWSKDMKQRRELAYWNPDEQMEFLPRLKSFFPNLQTIWAWVSDSPVAALGGPQLTMKKWDAATRQGGKAAIDAVQRVAVAIRGNKDFGDMKPIVWKRSADWVAPEPMTW